MKRFENIAEQSQVSKGGSDLFWKTDIALAVGLRNADSGQETMLHYS